MNFYLHTTHQSLITFFVETFPGGGLDWPIQCVCVCLYAERKKKEFDYI